MKRILLATFIIIPLSICACSSAPNKGTVSAPSSDTSQTTDTSQDSNNGSVDTSQTTTENTNIAEYIGLDKAKEIALSKVSGATAENIVKAAQDMDDGRMEYDIEIIYDNMEYEFEINASTGDIIDFSQESVYD